MSHAVMVRAEAGLAPSSGRYWRLSEMPLTSLLFLLPMIVSYELGTRYFTTAALHGHQQQIIAFTMMQRFFRLFGVHGQHLPALAVAVVLLAWHLARNERWQIDLYVLLGMAVESCILSMPLLALGRIVDRYVPLSAAYATRGDFVIMSLGAGVYEELVFRLILFSVLSLLLKDTIRLGTISTHLGVVFSSALLFAAYHYLSPVEHFQWRSFAFRTAAGIYFGVLFLLRGFGITAGSHAAYDVMTLFF